MFFSQFCEKQGFLNYCFFPKLQISSHFVCELSVVLIFNLSFHFWMDSKYAQCTQEWGIKRGAGRAAGPPLNHSNCYMEMHETLWEIASGFLRIIWLLCTFVEFISKGQLISKSNFLVLIWTKKWTKLFFDFCLKDQK